MLQFTKVEGVNTFAATSNDVCIEQIKVNLKRNLPKFHKLPEFQKCKGLDKKIAIVGGGPSLKDNLYKLKCFKTILAAGSSNDYLMRNNIIPTYVAIADPDPISACYLTLTDTETKYLISSNCHDDVFKSLEGKQIILWHSHSEDYVKVIKEIEGEYQAVTGGCTVGLRSINIALMMGYQNIHLFGFDSCLGENDKGYSYTLDEKDKSVEEAPIIYPVCFAWDSPLAKKQYRCLGYQLGQVSHFIEFYTVNSKYMILTFHGEGLLPDVFRAWDKINKGKLS